VSTSTVLLRLIIMSHNLTRASMRGHRRYRPRPLRSRLLRNRQMHAAWSEQMSDLVDAYLEWKNGVTPPDQASTTQSECDALNASDGGSNFDAMTVTLSSKCTLVL
jgi:hypothetical protein